jgi:nucleoside-diphosphate-sugar epimerase
MIDNTPQLRSQRVLVTGASGFIGAHLCRRLLSLGAELHAVSRAVRLDEDGARWWQCDLASFDCVNEIIATVKPQVIYHLASHVAGSRGLSAVLPTLRANLVSTVNVMTAAAGVGCRRIVLAGSLEEPQESAAVPPSPYAAAKWAASGYARMFHAVYGMQITNLRIAMVYGPGQSDGTKLIPYVIGCLLRGEPPLISSGRREVDWIYVDDVVDAFLASGNNRVDGYVAVEIGSGNCASIGQIAEQLCQLINPSIRPVIGAIADRPCDRSWTADAAAAQEALGWRPRTPLDEGLQKTVDWYQAAAAQQR